MRTGKSHASAPWGLWLLAGLVCFAITIPVLFLLLQASEGGLSVQLKRLLQPRLRELLSHTLLLAGAVLLTTLVLSVPMAWLTTRSHILGARMWTLLGVLPIAIPTYMMAYAYLSLGGEDGFFIRLLGWKVQRVQGFWGSWIVLSLCNLPYVFLNVRAGFLFLDPALEESSRSLGNGAFKTFFKVQLPQLLPALGSGSLIVILHVLGNFEVVSMMRYKTLSWEIYQVRMIDPSYASWLSIVLLTFTALVLWLDVRVLKKLQLQRTGNGTRRVQSKAALKWFSVPAYGFLSGLSLLGIWLPISVFLYWFFSSTQTILSAAELKELTQALICSLKSSLPAATLTTCIALPLMYLSVRFPHWRTQWVERISYFGYAIAPIALALSLVFVVLKCARSFHLTLYVLIAGLIIHFLAEALGPIRSALHQTPPQLEEASRALGVSRLRTFFCVTLPCLRKGLVISTALVFLSAMKELSLHLILSPPGYNSLAMEVWDRVENVEYAGASPYALSILLCSGLFVWVMFLQQTHENDGIKDR